MMINVTSLCKNMMDVFELEEFLRTPPPGFSVEVRGAGYWFVKSDPESCCVLIDDFKSSKGKIIFQHSPGKKIKVHNLGDYARVRKSLTSKKIYLLVSAYDDKPLSTDTKRSKALKELQRYVVAIDGSNPFIKWELERGLDRTISSVAGESYRVDIDLSDILRGWGGENFRVKADGEKIKPTWRDTCFTLKYYSDALFDFPYWFGFSKRQFKISYHGR